jgi:hypothetical protein
MVKFFFVDYPHELITSIATLLFLLMMTIVLLGILFEDGPARAAVDQPTGSMHAGLIVLLICITSVFMYYVVCSMFY